jgi:hypothetical protein
MGNQTMMVETEPFQKQQEVTQGQSLIEKNP